jgi:hypothetical protein
VAKSLEIANTVLFSMQAEKELDSVFVIDMRDANIVQLPGR